MENYRTSSHSRYDLKYHFVKAALTSNVIVVEDVASSEKPSDMLTKVLDLPKMTHLGQLIQLIRG